MSYPRKQEIVKKFNVCTICLSPVASCRQLDSLSQTCRLQDLFNLQCRTCGELSHHTLLCQQDTVYQSDDLSQTENWQDVNFSNPQHSSFPPTSNSSLPIKGHCPLIPVNVRLILLSQQIIKMQGFSQKYLKKLSKLKIQVKVNNYCNISKATSWT